MLKVPAAFPYPGSIALFGDRRARIVRIEPDGRRLILGVGRPFLTCTVDLDQLSDGSLPDDPMARWFAERVQPASGDVLPTPTEDLYRDFTGFARARGIDDTMLPTRHAFGAFLADQGHMPTVRKVDGRNQRCVPLALQPMKVAA